MSPREGKQGGREEGGKEGRTYHPHAATAHKHICCFVVHRARGQMPPEIAVESPELTLEQLLFGLGPENNWRGGVE